ncbi:MAG: hypothetical protein M0042_08915 [Nitrospiraceae bacterium]|nr:hypothetical protein [Nitrospiraceae bacterium]
MTATRPSSSYLLATCALLALLAAAAVHATLAQRAAAPSQARTAALVKRLELTDFALLTDARYSRNPSQADRHAPFQDHPLALEHFPSGSLIAVPPQLRERSVNHGTP